MENKNSIDYWIKNRKSTFLNGLQAGGKIEDSVIENLLENATWAPTHGLAQSWEFKVFSEQGVGTFYSKLQEIYKQTTQKEKFNEKKYLKYSEKSTYVSHVIVVISKRDPKLRFPKQEDLVAAACATQNIYLSLEFYGIAGYLSTGNVCYTKELRSFLSLDSEDECIGFFTLGIPKVDLKPRLRKRIPASEKTEWIKS